MRLCLTSADPAAGGSHHPHNNGVLQIFRLGSIMLAALGRRKCFLVFTELRPWVQAVGAFLGGLHEDKQRNEQGWRIQRKKIMPERACVLVELLRQAEDELLTDGKLVGAVQVFACHCLCSLFSLRSLHSVLLLSSPSLSGLLSPVSYLISHISSLVGAVHVCRAKTLQREQLLNIFVLLGHGS